MLAAEKASPQSAQRERHHRNRCAVDDALDARSEWIELARICDTPFREQTYQITGAECRRDIVIRLVENTRIFPRGRNRYCLARAKYEIEHRHPEDVVIHDEANRPGASRGNDQCVDEAHVVAYEHRGPALRNL